MIPFARTAGGEVRASFTDLERELLTNLATQAIALFTGDAEDGDPAVARLFPDAYRDDADAAHEFRRFTQDSLAERKLANAQALINAVAETGEIELGASAQQAWLRALTDIRLILGVRLGIEADDDTGSEETDADLMVRDIYDWLGYVQGSLVEALD
jgi:hypothetical protein